MSDTTDTYPAIPGELVADLINTIEGMMGPAGEDVLNNHPDIKSWHRTKGSTRHHLRRFLGLSALQKALEIATGDVPAVDRFFGALAKVQSVLKGDSPDEDTH